MKRQIITFLILFACILFFHKIALAEDSPSLFLDGGINSLLVSRHDFFLKVSDQVTDGCLPNPGKLKDKMEIALRKNGFGIVKEYSVFGADNILIEALGFKVGESSCSVYLSAKLIFLQPVSVLFANNSPSENLTLVSYVYSIGGVLLTGSRYSMQNQIEKYVVEFADKLYLDISRAQDDIFAKFPYIKHEINKMKKK